MKNVPNEVLEGRFPQSLIQLLEMIGRLFLHEHPDSASSWNENCIKEVLSKFGVGTTVTDQCQFGQRSREGEPIRKPTRWMSNTVTIFEELLWCVRGSCLPGGFRDVLGEFVRGRVGLDNLGVIVFSCTANDKFPRILQLCWKYRWPLSVFGLAEVLKFVWRFFQQPTALSLRPLSVTL